MAFRGKGYGGGSTGGSYTGMVKSYNRKGFGFIMCQGLDSDVYFARESLAPALQTSDLAGEYVTFDVHRFPDGKLQARNLRPVGTGGASRTAEGGIGLPSMIRQHSRPPPVVSGPGLQEDRTLDWFCQICGERNFTKRFECYKCKAPKAMPAASTIVGAACVAPPPVLGASIPPPAPPPRRNLSPHAGSRAMREMLIGGKGNANGQPADTAFRSRSRGKSRSSSSRSRRRSRKRSSSSSASSSKGSRRKRDSKRRRRKRNNSSSSSSDGSSSSARKGRASSSNNFAAVEVQPSNPEIDKAKAEVLEKLLQLKTVEPTDARIRCWRALLREWHPDKNPDRVEVATAVFQFLQKGKSLIDTESK